MTLASHRRVSLGVLACAAATFARTAAADPPAVYAPQVPPPQSAAPASPSPAPVAPGPGAPSSGAPGYPGEAPPVPPGYAASGSYAQPGYGPPGYAPAPGYYPGYPGMGAQPPVAHNAYTLPELPPRRRYDTGLFVGGVVAVSGGMALALVGAYLVSSAAGAIPIFCDTPSFPCAYKTDAPRLSGGAVLMAAGAAIGAAGIPMWLIGSQYVTLPKGEKRAATPDPRPELRVGAGNASVTWHF
jgi:hypothetical protein